MQISQVKPALSCISFDEDLDLQMTLKMGASEYISGAEAYVTANIAFISMEMENHGGIYLPSGPELFDTPRSDNIVGTWDTTIARGASKTFTMNGLRVPAANRQKILSRTGDNGAARRYPIYLAATADDDVRGYGDGPTMIGYFLTSRFNPVISTPKLTDKSPKNLYGKFGAFIEQYSNVQFDFDVSLDPLDTTLTATWEFTVDHPESTYLTAGTYPTNGVIGAGSSHVTVVEHYNDSTYWPGENKWKFTVTDSRGKTTTISGTYTVLPYTAPAFNSVTIQRYTESVDDAGSPIYLASDDGKRIWFDLDFTVTSIKGKNAWTLTRTIGEASSGLRLMYGQDGSNIRRNGVRTDTAEYDAAQNISVTLTLTDSVTSVNNTETVPKAGAYFNLEKFGVAIGQRTTATEAEKKFEVAKGYESYFYGGIWGVTNFKEGEVRTWGRWIDGKPIFRSVIKITTDTTSLEDLDIESLVSMVGLINFEYNGNGSYWATNYAHLVTTASQLNRDYYRVYINGSNLISQRGTYLTRIQEYVILEYTKTDWSSPQD